MRRRGTSQGNGTGRTPINADRASPHDRLGAYGIKLCSITHATRRTRGRVGRSIEGGKPGSDGTFDGSSSLPLDVRMESGAQTRARSSSIAVPSSWRSPAFAAPPRRGWRGTRIFPRSHLVRPGCTDASSLVGGHEGLVGKRRTASIPACSGRRWGRGSPPPRPSIPLSALRGRGHGTIRRGWTGTDPTIAFRLGRGRTPLRNP
eukprot:scaffold60_cov325-Pavlova_lutheri.AAC.23